MVGVAVVVAALRMGILRRVRDPVAFWRAPREVDHILGFRAVGLPVQRVPGPDLPGTLLQFELFDVVSEFVRLRVLPLREDVEDPGVRIRAAGR
jgi:hypothetical protein